MKPVFLFLALALGANAESSEIELKVRKFLSQQNERNLSSKSGTKGGSPPAYYSPVYEPPVYNPP
eukprot:4524873-Ditylum_brightwellii.AAC.1